MPDNQHTPGPCKASEEFIWIEGSAGGQRARIIYSESSQSPVAAVLDDEGDPECAANAALIAGVPVLLEYTREYLDARGADLYDLYKYGDRDAYLSSLERHNEVEAVLAAIEGREPCPEENRWKEE